MTTPPPAVPLSLESISLRKGERMLLAGGTGSGKSTLETPLIYDFVNRYRTGRVLVLDTKPRFRAEWLVTGVTARRRYRHWDHGTALTGSAIVDTPADLDSAWRLGHRIAIAQSEGGTDLARLCAIARRFFNQARASRPQLLVVDELLDFYGPTAAPRAGTDNILVVTARAGRERGLGGLYAGQRIKGYPTQILETMSKIALFRLDFTKDVDRLPECGAPPTLLPPEEDHDFVYWTKLDRRRVYGPYRLAEDAVR